MMTYLLMRFTPRKALTYNNRWYHPVRPKKNLFFIPPDPNQFFLWLDFLTNRHHRSYLYIHILKLRAVRKRTRTLTVWKGEDIREVMINARNYDHRLWFHTARVYKGAKKIPNIIQRYLKLPK